MKRLKWSLFVVVSLCVLSQLVQGGIVNYGEFGDGTSPFDTLYVDFTTWDTTGYSADADTYFIRRYYHTGLIDSTFGVAATNRIRTGLYSIPFQAFDGTNYGQYTVEIEWHKDTKFEKINGVYSVRAGNGEQAWLNIPDDGSRLICMSAYGNNTNTGKSFNQAKATLSGANDAADGAGETGSRVFISAGDFDANSCSSFTIDSTNISFIGTGAGRTVLRAITSQSIFNIDNFTEMGTRIKGLTIYGAGGSTTAGIKLTKGFGVEFKENLITGFDFGIHGDSGSWYGKIRDNYVLANQMDGLKLAGKFFDVDGNVLDSTTSVTADLIALNPTSRHITVRNNVIHGSEDNGYGIHLLGSGGMDATSHMIANNFVWTKTASKAYPVAFSAKNAYAGNWSKSSFAIARDDTSASVTDDIAHLDSVTNAITNTNKANFHSEGDTIQRNAAVAGDAMTFSGDTLRSLMDLLSDGVKYIYVDSASGGATNGGTCWDDAVTTIPLAVTKCTGAMQYEIVVGTGTYTDACSVDVSQLTIRPAKNARVNIDVSNAYGSFRVGATAAVQNVKITGFNISMTGGVYGGINAESATHCTFENNYMHDSPKGIELRHPATLNIVRGNIIQRCSNDGIHLMGSSNNYIIDNQVDSLTGGPANGIALANDGGSNYSRFNLLKGNIVRTSKDAHAIAFCADCYPNFLIDNYSHGQIYNYDYEMAKMGNQIYMNNHRCARDTTKVTEHHLGRLYDNLQPIRRNTAQAGAASSITLDANASAIDNFYQHCLVEIKSGTGANQSRWIPTGGYDGDSKVATVTPGWATNPDDTSVFIIWPASAEHGIIKIAR